MLLHKPQIKEEGDDLVVFGGTTVNKEREDMATIRPKSPRPIAIKGDKDESIWDKIGTLGRKKRIREGKISVLIILKIIFDYF